MSLTSPSPAAGRRILILDSDLYGQLGGGQSVYRQLVALCPGDQWFYFRRNEAADAPRPANATAIPLIEPLAALPENAPGHLHYLLWPWRLARNMALSVAEHLGQVEFDVAEVPDYTQLGPFIRLALRQEGCRLGTVALALHGSLSDAFRGGWPSNTDERRIQSELRLREHLQFRTADVHYAISDQYAEAWQRRIPRSVHRLDPLLMTGRPAPLPATPRDGMADLVFVGRREKWKGPDIFIDTAWCLDPASYRRLLLIGPEGPNRVGLGSQEFLLAAARRRGLGDRLEMPGGKPAEELRQLMKGRSLLLLPSRHDTFNLTALEALSLGCPTLVSARAGIARWLRARLPALDWALIDIDCGRAAAAAAAGVLADDERHREWVAEAFRNAALVPDASSLAAIHRRVDAPDAEALTAAIEVTSQFSQALMDERRGLRARLARAWPQGLPGPARALRAIPGVDTSLAVARSAIRRLPHPLRVHSRDALHRMGDVLARPGVRNKVLAAYWHGSEVLRVSGAFEERAFQQVRGQARNALLASELRGWPERTTPQMEAKLRRLSDAVPTRLTDRVALFREMARLERRLGNPLTSATYLLRTLRWTGTDSRGDLPFIEQALRDGGFVHEAATAAAMFDGLAHGPARCAALMADAYARNLRKPDRTLALLDDRRPADWQPRACVIASLYNAADKLPTLLGMLSRQTLAARAQGGHGALEVVLVDSASPGQDRAAFEAFAARHPELPICYARSAERETIQAAWNRGIKLARAPYLAFLGADEGLHPDALRQLAERLDAEPAVDWAMADSIVTNVDRAGVYDCDLMSYDRSGYRQDLVYLETCYLSWVGALYRRSIHDRFGYYDESFRAAGDTEFKNRIMPHIRSVHLPRALGVFNNYPEARTTQHPRAEIEDLRAWYLWRSPAGMEYAFANRPVAEAEALLRDCLGYRKSYCGHLSTDYDLAHAIATHLAGRPDAPDHTGAALQEMGRALDLLRRVEEMPDALQAPGRGVEGRYWVYQRLREARALARTQRERLSLADTPRFDIFNDNRYEQHWYSWSGG